MCAVKRGSTILADGAKEEKIVGVLKDFIMFISGLFRYIIILRQSRLSCDQRCGGSSMDQCKDDISH